MRDRPREQTQGDGTRRTLLEDGSASAAQRWVASWRDELRRGGRLAAGGWPGTMREARAMITSEVEAELIRRKLAPMSHDERERAARSLYALARRDWLAHAATSDPDDLVYDEPPSRARGVRAGG